MQNTIEEAIRILNQGGIIIFPTDTAFGIGCRIDREETIERLFMLRERPRSQATPVLVASLEMAEHYLKPVSPKVIEQLIKPYWPGALTIILPCKTEKVPVLVRGGTSTLGVRMPNHSTALELIKGTGVPILGPSANFHGRKTPYLFENLDPDLIRKADFVIQGKCNLNQPSTVIDCSITPWRIVREGAIKVTL